jgi:transcriptional regulator with XRE-family HTH domain
VIVIQNKEWESMDTRNRGKKKHLGGLMALNTFGKRLRILRTDRGLSQIDLRDALNERGVPIGETYISELERTDKMPMLHVAVGMADVLEVSLDYLALRTDDPTASSNFAQQETSYLSPEADEIAIMVDDMSQDIRALLIGLVRLMPRRRE